MSDDAKERIRAQLDIADIIGEVVALTSAGRDRLKGLCPFHSEKTPSFHVLRDTGMFYCFGCQAKGDIFDFVMRTRGMEFVEALQLLADRAGVTLEYKAGNSQHKRDLYDINQIALEFFRQQLQQHPQAMAYVRQRQLSEASIETFALGYAPDSWDALLRYASQQGVSAERLLEAGLISQNDNGRRYDRFRERIIFPIKDPLGRVVGFSGRVLDDSLPKYVNSPETAIFKKSQLLYGLDIARPAIRERQACIVVEGYMDVIALQQVGIGHVVAALGATMTQQQAELLSRLEVRDLYLAFDADEAGQRAVLSGLEHAVGRQFLVRAVRIPHGKDPAEAVLSEGPQAFLQALEHGLSEVRFRVEQALAQHDKHSDEGKKEILQMLLPALKPRDVFDPVAKEMRRLVIDELNLDGRRLDAWLSRQRGPNLDHTQVRGMERSNHSPSRLALIELETMSLLLLEPAHLPQRIAAIDAALPSEDQHSLLREFCQVCLAVNYDQQKILLHYREREESSRLFERIFSASQQDDDHNIDVERSLASSMSLLRDLYLTKQQEDQRGNLLERMQAINAQIVDPNLPSDVLQQCYRELRDIQELLGAREAERRIRLPSSFANKQRRRR